jgi:hypothetical protein
MFGQSRILPRWRAATACGCEADIGQILTSAKAKKGQNRPRLPISQKRNCAMYRSFDAVTWPGDPAEATVTRKADILEISITLE